eukprot:scaffold9517_cov117-Isochrysis_galbana.AAC.8
MGKRSGGGFGGRRHSDASAGWNQKEGGAAEGGGRGSVGAAGHPCLAVVVVVWSWQWQAGDPRAGGRANGMGTVRRVLAPRRNDGAAAPHIDCGMWKVEAQ